MFLNKKSTNLFRKQKYFPNNIENVNIEENKSVSEDVSNSIVTKKTPKKTNTKVEETSVTENN